MHTKTNTHRLSETWTNSVPLIFLLLLLGHMMPEQATAFRILFFGLTLLWSLVIVLLVWPHLSTPKGWTRVWLELVAAVFLAAQGGLCLLTTIFGGTP